MSRQITSFDDKTPIVMWRVLIVYVQTIEEDKRMVINVRKNIKLLYNRFFKDV